MGKLTMLFLQVWNFSLFGCVRVHRMIVSLPELAHGLIEVIGFNEKLKFIFLNGRSLGHGRLFRQIE